MSVLQVSPEVLVGLRKDPGMQELFCRSHWKEREPWIQVAVVSTDVFLV